MIVAVTGVNLAPKCVLPGNSKEKVGKEMPSDVLVMNNLETSSENTGDKAHRNANGSIVETFIKYTASMIFGHPEYSLDVPGRSNAVSGLHEDFSTVILVYG